MLYLRKWLQYNVEAEKKIYISFTLMLVIADSERDMPGIEPEPLGW